MSAGTLLRNEILKMRKRLAFWITFGLFLFMTVMNNLDSYLDARRDPEETFALPRAWGVILNSNFSIATLMFGSVVLILLMSSEFTWRTARQNVIDGLTKSQWYAGKVALLPVVAVILILAQVAIGGGFALAGTDADAAEAALFGLPFFQALGGFFLGFFVAGGLALTVAMAVRASGPAMAAWFGWFAIGEQLLPAGLGRLFPGLRPALGYLPMQTARRLLDYNEYDPAAFQRITEAAEAAGRPPPEPAALGTAFLVALGWIILFIGGSYVWFRRRDL
jgi:ABC-type transport system involved in multi-copper enzyme maturation permease subunit